VIDRIVHHATVLQTSGESYRLRDAKTASEARTRHRRRATKEVDPN
jgi:IstB-like ATP binding protein